MPFCLCPCLSIATIRSRCGRAAISNIAASEIVGAQLKFRLLLRIVGPLTTKSPGDFPPGHVAVDQLGLAAAGALSQLHPLAVQIGVHCAETSLGAILYDATIRKIARV